MLMTVWLRSMLMTVVWMSMTTASSFSCSVDGYPSSRVCFLRCTPADGLLLHRDHDRHIVDIDIIIP
jgi:hypothetical protein